MSMTMTLSSTKGDGVRYDSLESVSVDYQHSKEDHT